MIRGQVARVLTTRELVLNRGVSHGVKVGMRFAVLDPKAEHIKDPETGDELGSLYRPKVKVEVTRVEPRMSVAATYRKRRINVGGQGGAMTSLGKLFEPPQWVDEYDTFRTSDQAWQELPESQSYVKVGDPVIEISEREEQLDVETQTGLASAKIVNTKGPARGHPSSVGRRVRRKAEVAEAGEKPEADGQSTE